MCEFLGYKVVKLTRIRIMNIKLDSLPVGHWRYLSQPEMERLNDMMKGSLKTDSSKKPGNNRPKPQYSAPPANEREAKDRARKEAFLDGIPKKATTPSENGKILTSRAAKAKRLKEEYLAAKKNDPDRKIKAIAKKKDEEEVVAWEPDSYRTSSRFKGSSHKADKRERPEKTTKPAQGKKSAPSKSPAAKGKPIPKAAPGKGKAPISAGRAKAKTAGKRPPGKGR